MSISTKLQQFRDSNRICLSDKFIGDEGAAQLANFLNSHGKVQSLEIKSNDISAEGFVMIFNALVYNPTLKQLNIQHNNLGTNDYVQWHDSLTDVLKSCRKLQRLNLSNNKISTEGFTKLVDGITSSRSLKLLELRYNNIGNQSISALANALTASNNQVLLFVQLSGNKVKKQIIDVLQSYLSKNRKKNPITKQKLSNVAVKEHYILDPDSSYRQPNNNHTSILENATHQAMVRHLEGILDQNRRDTAESKIRLEQELAQLQQRQKLDAVQLNQLDKRCNEMIIVNRNLKFQLDRTLGQHQQLQRDQQTHLRTHQQKLRQTDKQLQDLQSKYEELQNRINKQHEIKMKEIVRDWQSRLRGIQQKIRDAQNRNSLLENQIRKHLQKRERSRLDCIEQENNVRSRVQVEQTHRFNFKIKQLESKLRCNEQSKNGYINRNQQLVYELEKSDVQNKREIAQLAEQLKNLRSKQAEFNAASKDFFTKNEKVKSDIQMKQITLQKLQQQIDRLDKEIQARRQKEQDEINKIKQNFQFTRLNRAQEKNSRLKKLNELQNNLRAAQLQSAKLRQQYGLLAQKLQVNISLAVHRVFQQNSLY